MAAGHASRLQTGAAWGARPPGKTGPRSEPYRRYRCKLYNMQKLQSYKVNVEFSSLDMSRPYVRSIGSCLAGSPRSLLSCCRHGCRCHSYLLFMHACTVGLQGGGWRQHPLGSSHSIAAQGMHVTTPRHACPAVGGPETRKARGWAAWQRIVTRRSSRRYSMPLNFAATCCYSFVV